MVVKHRMTTKKTASVIFCCILFAAMSPVALAQARHAAVPGASIVGLGIAGDGPGGDPGLGVISVYPDHHHALVGRLVNRDSVEDSEEILLWTAGKGLTPVLSHVSDIAGVSGNGRVLVIGKIDIPDTETRGGHFYGHYVTWSAGGKQQRIGSSNPLDRISYQMGMVWEFHLSYDGKRLLVSGEASPNIVMASDAKSHQLKTLRVAGIPISSSDRKPGLFTSPIIALSPDGGVILTADGTRYRIVGQISKLVPSLNSNLLDQLGAGDSSGGDISVSRGLQSVVTVKVDGPDFVQGEDQTEQMKKLTGHLLRWDEHHGLRVLTTFRGGGGTAIVSEDGQVIAGQTSTAFDPSAFVWTQKTGLKSLGAVVNELLPSKRHWRLQGVKWLSADGTVMAGEGINPKGKRESWMLVLPKNWPDYIH